MPHLSDSTAQSTAEQLILGELAKRLQASLEPRRLELSGGSTVHVDGVAPDESILVEVFARQGRLKAGQRGKVARDALKLITLGAHRPDATLILALADHEAAKPLLAAGWLAEALATFKVQVVVLELDDAQRAAIVEAQARQVMVNPSATAAAEQAPPPI